MKLLPIPLLVLSLVLPLRAERPAQADRIPYRASVAVLLAGSTADAAGSWRGWEANPALRSADGRFGARGMAIKAAVTGSILAVQWIKLRRQKDQARAERERRAWTRVNVILGGYGAGLAVRNWRVRAQ